MKYEKIVLVFLRNGYWKIIFLYADAVRASICDVSYIFATLT